jgi:glycosyltransferase 2 family protein
MRKKALQLLKLIGIVLFLLILSRLDRGMLVAQLRAAHGTLIAIGCVFLILSFLCKALRWHTLVRRTPYQPALQESWRVYMIGVFLGAITPAKIGELGRVTFLKQRGVSTGTGLLVAIADRAYDIIVIALLASIGVGVLFGWQWTALCLLGGGVLFLLVTLVAMQRKRVPLGELTRVLWSGQLQFQLFGYTILSWVLYFTWAALLARSLDIPIALPQLVSAFTVTGIVAMLPIAPSGLGTRDAALLTLLAPYGVAPAQAVALALLMFATTIALSGIGGWYWMRTSNKFDQ